MPQTTISESCRGEATAEYYGELNCLAQRHNQLQDGLVGPEVDSFKFNHYATVHLYICLYSEVLMVHNSVFRCFFAITCIACTMFGFESKLV